MNNRMSIEVQLSKWGKQMRTLPEHSRGLRESFLRGFVSVASQPVRIPWFSSALWLPALCVALAVAVFVFVPPHVLPQQPATLRVQQTTSKQDQLQQAVPSAIGAQSFSKSASPEVGLDALALSASAPETLPITDTRELLKTDYSATVNSRNVMLTTQRLQTLVRGFGGRVDVASSGEQFGHVTFVLPADKLVTFRSELKSAFGDRFVTEQLGIQNMLPEKQGLEAQAEVLRKTIDQLRTSMSDLAAQHIAKVHTVQAQLSANLSARTSLTNEQRLHPERWADLQSNILELDRVRSGLRNQLAQEDAAYASSKSSQEEKLRATEESLSSVQMQDSHLLETVATVRGGIDILHIGLFQVVNAYAPWHWTVSLVLLVCAVMSFILQRRAHIHKF
jgi:hypothetical protein